MEYYSVTAASNSACSIYLKLVVNNLNMVILTWMCYFVAMVCFVVAQETCKVSFSETSYESEPKIISGFNDVLGPVINLTFFDDALTLATNKLYTGKLNIH